MEWQETIVSLKGQADAEGSVIPLSIKQNAVTDRADTAENICSLGSLTSFSRSFWQHSRSTDSQERSNWAAQQEDRLQNPVVDFGAVVNCSSGIMVF